jgi:hypothetical protein
MQSMRNDINHVRVTCMTVGSAAESVCEHVENRDVHTDVRDTDNKLLADNIYYTFYLIHVRTMSWEYRVESIRK